MEERKHHAYPPIKCQPQRLLYSDIHSHFPHAHPGKASCVTIVGGWKLRSTQRKTKSWAAWWYARSLHNPCLTGHQCCTAATILGKTTCVLFQESTSYPLHLGTVTRWIPHTDRHGHWRGISCTSVTRTLAQLSVLINKYTDDTTCMSESFTCKEDIQLYLARQSFEVVSAWSGTNQMKVEHQEN